MADPLSILGAAASCLQIVSFICTTGSRLFEKPKDLKTLQSIGIHCKTCITHLHRFETSASQDPDVTTACSQLRAVLEDVVREIESIEERKKIKKWITALTLYSAEFQSRLTLAFEVFQFQMCIRSRQKSEEANAKIDEMTEQLKKLEVSATALRGVDGTEEIQANLSAKMDTVSDSLRELKRGIELVRGQMQAISVTVSQFPKIMEQVKKEGKETRNAIHDSKVEVLERLDRNESTTRILSEAIPDPEAITWYTEDGPSPPFRLWSLDTPLNGGNESRPSAQFNGLELAVQPSSQTIDQILGKRHAAFEFDQSLSNAKRRRTDDLTPYVALGGRENRFQILQEFMPQHLIEKWMERVPVEMREEVLRVSRSLGQEYRYFILDRIIKGNYYTSLDKLSRCGSLERSMLALQAEKIQIGLTIRSLLYPWVGILVDVSSVGYAYKKLEHGWPHMYLDDHEFRKYSQQLTQVMASQGREGLSALLREVLALVIEPDSPGTALEKILVSWGCGHMHPYTEMAPVLPKISSLVHVVVHCWVCEVFDGSLPGFKYGIKLWA